MKKIKAIKNSLIKTSEMSDEEIKEMNDKWKYEEIMEVQDEMFKADDAVDDAIEYVNKAIEIDKSNHNKFQFEKIDELLILLKKCQQITLLNR